eukprot:1434057-Prymnesium_polylepis.1
MASAESGASKSETSSPDEPSGPPAASEPVDMAHLRATSLEVTDPEPSWKCCAYHLNTDANKQHTVPDCIHARPPAKRPHPRKSKND